MSEPDYTHVKDVNVPHEAETAEATDAQMRRTSDHAAVADSSALATHAAVSAVAAPSAGYVQAEAEAAKVAINLLITQLAAAEAKIATLVTKVNELLDVDRDAELLPTP